MSSIIMIPFKKETTVLAQLQECSHFETFLQKTANIPTIWDTLISKLSGADIARCLKVNSELRAMITKCLSTNAILQQETDSAAAVSALSNGRFRKTVEVQFKRQLSGYHADMIFAIDDAWYYRQRTSKFINIHKLSSNCDSVCFPKYLPSREDHLDKVMVFPTSQAGRYLYHYNSENKTTKNLIDVQSNIARIVSTIHSIMDSDCGLISEITSSNINEIHCVWYKLYVQIKNGNHKIFMASLDMKGKFRKDTMLYQYQTVSKYQTYAHSPSNEQANFFIVLPDAMAVHCAISGVTLWRRMVKEEDQAVFRHSDFLLYGHPSPFITKDIAGYFLYFNGEDDGGGYFALRIYNTASGEYVTSAKFPSPEVSEICLQKFIARGRSLIYSDNMKIFVFKVVGNKVRKYKLLFPEKHLINTQQISSHGWLRCICLLGFIGKTNVIVGNLQCRYTDSEKILFCLNLNTVFKAKNMEEANCAFSIPSVLRSLGHPEDDFKPVYKTDNSSRSVELIGVMRKKRDSKFKEFYTVENAFFVTGMHILKNLE